MFLGTFIASLLATLFQPSATIVFAGDAMQHQRQLDAAHSSAGYNYDQCFEDIAPWVSEADYAVVNLETPLGEKNFTGYPCFNSPKEYAAALKNAGFDLFLTANNHTLDRRDAGLKQTIATLDSLHVDHIGTYMNRDARNSALPFIKEINNFKVAFLNYTYGTNGISPREPVVVDLIDKTLITNDIKNARDAGAEIVVVTIHWGIEYVLLPPAQVKQLADFLCKQDVDMVIGGHPHVIQPMEIRDNPTTGRQVLLVYSMGNLISGMRTRDTRGGAMVKATLQRDDNGKAYFSEAQYMPHFTIPGTSPENNFRVVLIPENEDIKNKVPAQWQPQANAWYSSSIPVFEKHNKGVNRASLSTP